MIVRVFWFIAGDNCIMRMCVSCFSASTVIYMEATFLISIQCADCASINRSEVILYASSLGILIMCMGVRGCGPQPLHLSVINCVF